MLSEMGLSGLEVAPSRVWRDTWPALKIADVSSYKRAVEAAGLKVIGLHSLFYDQPDLGLFRDHKTRAHTLDFMEHLSKLCRDLGGKTLTYGGGRSRGDLSMEEAFIESELFFSDLIPRIESHGTVFCFEPLAPSDSDFINSVNESIRLVEAVNHPSLKVQLDAKALAATDEMTIGIFKSAAPYLVHVHANEPDLGVLGTSSNVDHCFMGSLLGEIGYDGYVSIEQKMVGEDDPLVALSKSAGILQEFY
jgi:sugar phosphate isomerase/epimerase